MKRKEIIGRIDKLGEAACAVEGSMEARRADGKTVVEGDMGLPLACVCSTLAHVRAMLSGEDEHRDAGALADLMSILSSAMSVYADSKADGGESDA